MTVDYINGLFNETAQNFNKLTEQTPLIINAVNVTIDKMRDGGKVMFCGNGGSAADAQHFAAELMGRFLIDRRPLSAIALSTNTSSITAIGNDYTFNEIFERQVLGVGKPGDVIICISTSGNSENIIRAANAAKNNGIFSIGLTGEKGGKLAGICDISIRVPSSSTPRIQEMHVAVGHAICDLVEKNLA